MAKVTVYRKDTGERVQVPEHWVGHKTLGKPFRKTPPTSKTTQVQEPAPAAGDDTTKEH